MKHQGLTLIAALLSCLILLTCLPGCSKPIGPSDEQIKNDITEISERKALNGMKDIISTKKFHIRNRKALDETRVEIALASDVEYDVGAMRDILSDAYLAEGKRKLTRDLKARGLLAKSYLDNDEEKDGKITLYDTVLYRLNKNGVWVIQTAHR